MRGDPIISKYMSILKEDDFLSGLDEVDLIQSGVRAILKSVKKEWDNDNYARRHLQFEDFLGISLENLASAAGVEITFDGRMNYIRQFNLPKQFTDPVSFRHLVAYINKNQRAIEKTPGSTLTESDEFLNSIK